MKKKELWISISIFFIVFLVSGCASDSPKEVLDEAFTKTSQINSQQSSFALGLNMDGDIPSNDPETQLMISLLNGSEISGSGKVDGEKNQLDFNMTMAGMAFEGEIYMDEEISAIKFPLINNLMGIGDKYLVDKISDTSQPKDESPLPSFQKEDMMTLNEISKNALMKVVDDEKITVTEGVDLEIPEETVTGTKYSIELSNDQIVRFVEQIVLEGLNNDILKDKTMEFLVQQASILGIGLTEEEIQDNPSELVKQLYDTGNENRENTLEMNLMLDKENYIRNTEILLTFSLQDPETQKSMNLSMDIQQKVWNINNPIDFIIPEFNDTNSVDVNELTEENNTMEPTPIF